MAQRLFQRLDGGPLEPAEFRVDIDPMDGSRSVVVACPKCGHASTIDGTIHTVRRDGAVSPIWPCENQACSHVDWLLLTEEVL